MATFTGTAANNTRNGTGLGDTFNYMQGGNDTLRGLNGDDNFKLGATFSALDRIAGGGGANDKLLLAGNYAAGVIFAATTLTGVEQVTLGAGFSYKLTTHNATVAANQVLTVNGAALAAGKSLKFNGGAELDGRFVINAGAGNDTLAGGAKNDTFNLATGGNDIANGGGGNDTFNFGASLTAADALNGGAGAGDVLNLAGDYSAGVTFGAATVTGIESIILAAGFAYKLTTNGATVANLATLAVDGGALAAGQVLDFNGAAETTGVFTLTGGAANDLLTGGGGADTFNINVGGNDTVTGGGGNDTTNAGSALTADDKINGGSGTNDILNLNGDYSAGITFTATTVVNVERIVLADGNRYDITTHDATVANNATLIVDASALGDTLDFTFDGSAETNGSFNILGGEGDDIITGGQDDDTLSGGEGSDEINADGGGNDTITAGEGGDTIRMGGSFNPDDQIDGGADEDTLHISGDYSGFFTLFEANTITNIEYIEFGAGNSYNGFNSHEGNLATGQVLVVDASNLGAANWVRFAGSEESDGSFVFISGNGEDDFTGGDQGDTFDFTDITTLAGGEYDTLTDLNLAGSDLIKFRAVTTIDADINIGGTPVVRSQVDGFLADTADIDAGGTRQLSANGVVRVLLVSDFCFMVIDGNGTAGYQPGSDLVLLLHNFSIALGTVDTSDFIA